MARCKSAALLLALSACAAPTRRQCELEPPELIARSEGLAFDGIAVSGELFAWSERDGLSVRAGHAQPLSLGARCAGGIDLAQANGTTYVACSRPHEAGGEVIVYRLAAGRIESTQVGRAGRDGRGVAISADGTHVAFHEGSVGDHAIWLARVGQPAQRISQLGSAVREPALRMHDGHAYVAFAELVWREDGAPASALWISRDGAPALRIAEPRAFSPTPKLTTDARGLLLAYRDKGREGARNELRVVRLDGAGKLAGASSLVGRANADGEPNLYGCGGLIAALLPREYGGERYVGIHPLDAELSALGAGHQLYESGHDFVLASGTCSDRGLLLFAADRAAPSKPGVQAVALRFRCAE